MKHEQPDSPWWKHGYVWLVIAGPAAVVVAGLVTVWVAARSPDVVLTDGNYRRAEVHKNAADPALMPAIQGRNHAAAVPSAR